MRSYFKLKMVLWYFVSTLLNFHISRITFPCFNCTVQWERISVSAHKETVVCPFSQPVIKLIFNNQCKQLNYQCKQLNYSHNMYHINQYCLSSTTMTFTTCHSTFLWRATKSPQILIRLNKFLGQLEILTYTI